MSGAELKALAVSIWGRHGWQTGTARALQVNVSTVRRWVDKDEVPQFGPTAVAIRLVLVPKS